MRSHHTIKTILGLIDPIEDQIRIYPLDDRMARGVVVLGARTIEERQDFWIIT